MFLHYLPSERCSSLGCKQKPLTCILILTRFFFFCPPLLLLPDFFLPRLSLSLLLFCTLPVFFFFSILHLLKSLLSLSSIPLSSLMIWFSFIGHRPIKDGCFVVATIDHCKDQRPMSRVQWLVPYDFLYFSMTGLECCSLFMYLPCMYPSVWRGCFSTWMAIIYTLPSTLCGMPGSLFGKLIGGIGTSTFIFFYLILFLVFLFSQLYW